MNYCSDSSSISFFFPAVSGSSYILQVHLRLQHSTIPDTPSPSHTAAPISRQTAFQSPHHVSGFPLTTPAAEMTQEWETEMTLWAEPCLEKQKKIRLFREEMKGMAESNQNDVWIITETIQAHWNGEELRLGVIRKMKTDSRWSIYINIKFKK